MTQTPNFRLSAYTYGGPPTNNTWTRDGQVIVDNGNSFVTTFDSFRRARLYVTGTFPGVYQYMASNRATPTVATYTINIEGIIILCIFMT